MHWHILGAGAIGCLWADFLSQAGHQVSLILRNRTTLEQWPGDGRLEITEANQQHQTYCQLETPDTEVPVRHLLVATKAYDTLSAMEAIQSRLQPEAEVVLLQNGMGQQQQLLEQLKDISLWTATTTAGAWLESRHQLHCVSRGETHIGPLTQHSPLLPSGWDTLDITLHPCPDIRPYLWRKLAINCAINPLTALFDCRNGALIETSERQETMRRVCREVEQVAAAAGIELFPEPLEERAAAVARATGDNFSSMLQDIRHGRRSEIEQITGFLCEQAQQLGIAVPVNLSLLQAIRAKSPGKYTR
ncbi:ketopantoate reductase family protein [Marinobacterium sediminicola]|uniref:2-dehydropantoate 2-reductase n=1 Tax=Marinobacterium sediminicola TaxID=518898 RepID=A0ABY1RXZ1_9GAMM|nr:2-dehydropantoate 2-reductase [Marinobacterium sediminicola]ULG68656.1 2-dehydropantoate 2-reductase [Marinobacterium sediminicola]SMR73179.1 2-dehydropantoate 2-reductase [Marinobacterium sediminicola]